MPILASTIKLCASSPKGWSRAMSSLSAADVAPMALVAGRSKPNSSPPSRATVSDSRRRPCRRVVSCCSSTLPYRCICTGQTSRRLRGGLGLHDQAQHVFDLVSPHRLGHNKERTFGPPMQLSQVVRILRHDRQGNLRPAACHGPDEADTILLVLPVVFAQPQGDRPTLFQKGQAL